MDLWLSPNYVAPAISIADTKFVALIWGFTLGFTALTVVKAANQTRLIWRRRAKVTTYMTLIWLEIVVDTVLGFLCWFLIDGELPVGFPAFFLILFFWSLQLHFLLQILCNRIAVLMPNRKKAEYIKWATAIVVTMINVSVFCLWIPARLQISEKYMHLNDIWDRVEKVMFLLIDMALNGTFMYLVYNRLIAAGFAKYQRLFNYNLAMVFISLSMDVLIIGMMSLKNTLVYTQFHPLAYIVKLNIEINLMGLISKIAKMGQAGENYDEAGGRQCKAVRQRTQAHGLKRSSDGLKDNLPTQSLAAPDYYHTWVGGPQEQKARRDAFPDDDGGVHELDMINALRGRDNVIMKTVQSTVRPKSPDDFDGEAPSEAGSTKVLKP